MDCSSRTGLVPAVKKRHTLERKIISHHLPKQFDATPMALRLRPYGGLYNPFAKTCSILCNHPAKAEIKKIIHQCRRTLTAESKNLLYLQELSKINDTSSQTENIDNIPEDLFRRYTDTDSRPLTPTPTVTSIHTRTSECSLLNNRRCITPELGETETTRRKKLILDLRRFRSQEALYGKASSISELSYGDILNKDHIELKVHSATAIEERKAARRKNEKSGLKSCLDKQFIQEEGLQNVVELQKVNVCINEESYGDDLRRGKKPKKSKKNKPHASITNAIPTTNTLHLNEDPETQISTLELDSLNVSTRHSFVTMTDNLLNQNGKGNDEHKPLNGSFLTEEAFKALKVQLDADKIENTFEKCLNRALKEAYRYLSIPPYTEVHNTTEELKNLDLNEETLPRKFTRSATRFEVPMDLTSLENLRVIDYLSNFVWVSRQRKHLYKKIFLKYYVMKITQQHTEKIHEKTYNTDEEHHVDGLLNQESFKHYPHDEYIDRSINLNVLPVALKEILQFHGHERNIACILQLIDYENIKNDIKEINYRTWCGIVAFAERFIVNEINTHTDSDSEFDSCDELEKQDFISLSLVLSTNTLSEGLQKIFKIICSTHHKEEKNTSLA